MALVINQTFESGLAEGTAVTTSNSANGGTAILIQSLQGGAAETYTGVGAAHGLQGMRVVCTNATTDSYRNRWDFTADTNGMFSASLEFTLNSLPSLAQDFLYIVSASGFIRFGINVSNTFAVKNISGTGIGSPSAVAVAGTRYRAEIQGKKGTTTTDGQIFCQVFVEDSTTPFYTVSSTTTNTGTADWVQAHIGEGTGAFRTCDITYDGFRLDNATQTALGPSITQPIVTPTFVGAGAWAVPAVATAVAPAYPTGLAQDDVVYASIVTKMDTTTVATPTGWTFCGSSAVLGTGAAGAGVGTLKVFLFKRLVPSGGLTGTQSFTLTGNDTSLAVMHAWRMPSGSSNIEWTPPTMTSYTRTTGSTTFGGTGGQDIQLQAGDVLVHINGSTDDQSSTLTISGLSATGTTLGTLVQSPAGTAVNAFGNDISAASAYAPVTAGPSSAAPVSTVTGSSAETGGGFFFRVRAQASAGAVYTPTQPDSVGVTDARTVEQGRNPADPVGVTDSASFAADAPRSPGDPVGVTDAATATLGRDVTIGDSVGVTDGEPVQVTDIDYGITDVLGVTDAEGLDRFAAPSDAVGATDALDRVADYDRPTSDAVGATDVATPVLGAGRVADIADGVGVTDLDVTQTTDDFETFGDPIGVTDVVTVTGGGTVSFNDPLGVSDNAATVASATRGSTDNAGATDSVSASVDAPRAAADPAGLSDLAATVVAAERGPLDAVGLSDAISAVMSKVVTVDDFLALTDAASGSLASGPTATPSDPVGVTDALSQVIDFGQSKSDPVGMTDSAVALLQRTANVTETVSLTDTLVTALVHYADLADAVGVLDVASTVGPPPIVYVKASGRVRLTSASGSMRHDQATGTVRTPTASGGIREA